MKKIKLLTAATLLTSIVVGNVATVYAAENGHEIQTEGTVSFTAGDDNEVIPPVEPPVVIDPIDPDDQGPLSILYAPTIAFGTQKISPNKETYQMIAEKQKLITGELIPYVSFAQVVDTRGTNAGWTLAVTASQFKNNNTTNKELTGATITLLESNLAYSGEKGQEPTISNADITLTPEESVTIMSAEKGTGALISSVVWGDQSELDKEFLAANDPDANILNEKITLEVPGKIAKDAVTYTASLEWSLTNTPGN